MLVFLLTLHKGLATTQKQPSMKIIECKSTGLFQCLLQIKRMDVWLYAAQLHKIIETFKAQMGLHCEVQVLDRYMKGMGQTTLQLS